MSRQIDRSMEPKIVRDSARCVQWRYPAFSTRAGAHETTMGESWASLPWLWWGVVCPPSNICCNEERAGKRGMQETQPKRSICDPSAPQRRLVSRRGMNLNS